MTSSFAGRGQARACWWRKQRMNMRRGGWGGLGGGFFWLKSKSVCVCRWIFPSRTHLTGNQCTERHKKWGGITSAVRINWGNVLLSYPHVPESGCQKVTARPPLHSFFLLPPSSYSPSSSSVWRKKNLLSIEIARPISAYFCFERKGKHWLKNWVGLCSPNSTLFSQFYWCSPAFFCLFAFSSLRPG